MMLRSLALALAAALALGFPAAAKQITCQHGGSGKFWINWITINTETKVVTIDQGPYESRVKVVQGVLRYADDGAINGYPAFAFDTPTDNPAQRNVFKLFKPLNEWRLIDAGVLYVDGQPTLVALGEGVAFDCR
jgi:hypothetical protein